MLILTRRIGETIVIGDDLDDLKNTNITVLGVSGNQVRFGVKAPREVSVHREEIKRRIDFEKQKGQYDAGRDPSNTEKSNTEVNGNY